MKAGILGVGMTPFGRWTDVTLPDLARRAAREALDDAGIDPADVSVAVVGNAAQGAIDGQHGIRGQLMLRGLDLTDIPIVNVENACASASTALHVATAYVASGIADVALAVGAEKMVTADPRRSLDAFEGSWDRADRNGTRRRLADFAAATPVPDHAGAGSDHSVFMDVYAAFARDHMARYGTTVRQLAVVSAKNHAHSVANANAQFRRPFSVEQILTARPVVWPFTVPMCSAVSDGAAAAVIVSADVARRAGSCRAVGIRALEMAHGGGWTGEHIDDHVSRRAARRLWEKSGVDPRDVDVAEVHDATAIGEIQQIEHLGLVGPGEGGPAAERGRTSIGGDIPVNPSGGLESRGHPIGATGLAQVFELVTQLRGEAGSRQIDGARMAVAENGGGLIGLEEAAVSMVVLEAAS
jgi:acetyl-CoA acetyltransferase